MKKEIKKIFVLVSGLSILFLPSCTSVNDYWDLDKFYGKAVSEVTTAGLPETFEISDDPTVTDPSQEQTTPLVQQRELSSDQNIIVNEIQNKNEELLKTEKRNTNEVGDQNKVVDEYVQTVDGQKNVKEEVSPKVENQQKVEVLYKTAEQIIEINKVSHSNISIQLYHLLILDRINCSINSDISNTNDMKMIYKFKHGKNGYIIAIYISSKEGAPFSILPEGSRILVDLQTVRKATIIEYVNSSAFAKFVMNRIIKTQILTVLRKNI